jgi:hypothetical protein
LPRPRSTTGLDVGAADDASSIDINRQPFVGASRQERLVKQSSIAAACGALLQLVAFASPLGAITVENANNSGPDSLRAAMESHASIIDFSPSFFSSPRTISLLSPLPTIQGDLTMVGPGANLLSIDGQLRTYNSALITIYGSPTVRLEGFTLKGGNDPLSTGNVGGIFTRAHLTLAKVSLIGNRGTGVFNQGGNLTVLQSSIIGNTSEGVFNQGGDATIINSTFAENLVGVYNQVGDLSVFNSTIARNSQAGVASVIFETAPPMGSLTIESSILADNGAADLSASHSKLVRHSLVEKPAGLVGNGNLVGLDPALGPLTLGGGPTRTLTPQPGSPAIDAGSNPLALAVDQRGAPRILGQRIDIGAVEAVPEPALPALGAVAAAWVLPRARRSRVRSKS